MKHIEEFDREKADALRRIWFVGDVHGMFRPLAETLLGIERPKDRPRWIVFAGDIDINHAPFKELMAPLYRFDPSVKVAFIHGNHDADTYENWEMLHDAGDAVALHGKVTDLDGVRVAGLGGHFLERVWYPPAEPNFMDQDEALKGRGFHHRHGLRPSPKYLSAIYPADVIRMESMRADILLTHEAPSSHPRGFEVLDELARSLQVARAIHGHHHDDLTADYALKRESLGFDAVGLRGLQIKNGLGEEIYEGGLRW